ncbi:unnamed protein product, partial [Ectocarpus sp. 4 AP-2014]
PPLLLLFVRKELLAPVVNAKTPLGAAVAAAVARERDLVLSAINRSHDTKPATTLLLPPLPLPLRRRCIAQAPTTDGSRQEVLRPLYLAYWLSFLRARDQKQSCRLQVIQ